VFAEIATGAPAREHPMKNLSLLRKETVSSQTGKLIDLTESREKEEPRIFSEQSLEPLRVGKSSLHHQVTIIALFVSEISVGCLCREF